MLPDIKPLLSASDRRRYDAAHLIALPEDAKALIAQGMHPSYVLELNPPKNHEAITARLIAALARTPARSVADVAAFFDAVNDNVNRFQLIRTRGMLHRAMTHGASDFPEAKWSRQVMDIVGPRAHDWRGGRTDGDIYSYLAGNAIFVAWWLIEEPEHELIDPDLVGALSDQLRFWEAVQKILARGL